MHRRYKCIYCLFNIQTLFKLFFICIIDKHYISLYSLKRNEMTVFRKVSVKERLPNEYEDVFCIDKNGNKQCGDIEVLSNCDIVCHFGRGDKLYYIEYWLEEIELPEIKDVCQEGAWCGCRDYDAGMNEILELFK